MHVFFRLLRVNKLQMLTLKRLVSPLTVTELKSDGVLARSDYTVAVPLSPELIEELMMFVVRQQIALADCDVLVQVATTEHIQVMPALVSQLLKQFDCRVCVQVVPNAIPALLDTAPIKSGLIT